MIEIEELELEFEFEDDVLNLSSLSGCIDSLIGGKNLNTNESIKDITGLRASIDWAADLLLAYEDEKDQDLKHEFGYQYSELLADIYENIDELNENGINLYIH